MDKVVSTSFAETGPGATVLVVKDGHVLLRKGYGLADLELSVPMGPDQVLPLCSITKQFTAVAILQLVQAGKLKLSDALSQYLPDYSTQGATITIEELLTHSAGVPSIEEQPEARKHWGENLTPEQLLDYTRNRPLAFAPGTNWKYSNTGYYLLGRVIEKISGQSYPDYIRAHLLEPAGMQHALYAESARLVANRGRGYSRSGKVWANATYFNLAQGYSAGALLATVDDLKAWEDALQSGRLVDAEWLRRAYAEGHLPDGRSTHYGFGWEISTFAGHPALGHAGGLPGFCSFEARVADVGIYVAILCNTDAPSVPLRKLADRLVRLALNQTAETSEEKFSALPSTLQDYVGSYQIAPGANFLVTAKDGVLIGQLGPGRRPMKATALDEFSADGDMSFHFVRDAARRVTAVRVASDGPGPELYWSRLESARNVNGP